MRMLLGGLTLVFVLMSCSPKDSVQINGRVENGDSIVSIWVNDSVYSFPLDENDSFSGNIYLKGNAYATLLPYSLNLYLSPGEDLELYVNALNVSGSLYFRGSLSAVNTYLKEQEVAVFFDKDYYSLSEEVFIKKMQDMIDEKTKLLEAKNFDKSFTDLEKQRIRYSVAERVAFYPMYQKRMGEVYKPGKAFTDFLSSFTINNEELFGAKDFRRFLLNYVYFQGSRNYTTGENFSVGITDYILSTVSNPVIKDFLLSEVLYRYIWENNGLAGAEYLLSVFRRECSDPSKMSYIEELVEHWSKLSPGRVAPDFHVKLASGQVKTLADYKGSYLYITVWATWCVPCKSELPYIDLLMKEYLGKNIQFMTIAIDGVTNEGHWKSFLANSPNAEIHAMADAENQFNEDYMVISVPRFILIDPKGKIVNSNAPRPSGQIRQFFDGLDL